MLFPPWQCLQRWGAAGAGAVRPQGAAAVGRGSLERTVLLNRLARHTPDAEQIDRVFRRSGLYRPKWERADYRERTICVALGSR